MAISINGGSSGDYMKKGVDYVTAGQKSGTTLGTDATAEGYKTTASGNYAHAEGSGTVADGEDSHAEGSGTTASGNYAHAEGSSTTASGAGSHAEGYVTTASGNNSHAEGYYSTAQRKSQHVFGEYNVLDTGGTDTTTRGTYVEIVGNGTSGSARSNARTLDWSGNEVLAGKLTVGADPTNNMDVATKLYVDTELNSVKTSVSNGKSAIASAITDKGVSTSGSDSFATMASNIASIKEAPLNWEKTLQTTLPGSYYACGKVYGGDKFVMMCGGFRTSYTNASTDKVLYSFDGITWIQSSMPSTRNWHTVTYGKGKFVAVSDTVGAYSNDGITWTQFNLPTSNTAWRDVYYSDGYFILFGYKDLDGRTLNGASANTDRVMSNKAAYSTSGTSFTSVNLPSTHFWADIASGSGKYIIVNRDSYVIAYSTTGTSWSSLTLPTTDVPSGRLPRSILYAFGMFLISDNYHGYWYSYDGSTWTYLKNPTNTGISSPMVYGNGKIIIYKGQSIDGINWTTLPDSSGYPSCYGRNVYLSQQTGATAVSSVRYSKTSNDY